MARYEEFVGTTRVTLTGYDSGMRKLITDTMFAPVLTKHAEESKVRAQALAEAEPTRKWENRGSRRRTGKRYRSSFETDIGYGTTIDGTARIRARLINTNPFAFYIEYGNANINPARRIVRTAAGIYRFDAEGDKY